MRRTVVAALLALSFPAFAQTPAMAPDIPAKFDTVIPNADYIKRDVMIPMRDGVKLHTVIVIPKDAQRAPIVLTRTPLQRQRPRQPQQQPQHRRHSRAGR